MTHMTHLKEQNKDIIIIGDFNGHIHSNDGGSQELHETNENGRLLIDLIRSHNLTLIYSSENCKGTCTWIRANQKAVVDYVLTNKSASESNQNLVIDDTSKNWTIGSDHSCMDGTK